MVNSCPKTTSDFPVHFYLSSFQPNKEDGFPMAEEAAVCERESERGDQQDSILPRGDIPHERQVPKIPAAITCKRL